MSRICHAYHHENSSGHVVQKEQEHIAINPVDHEAKELPGLRGVTIPMDTLANVAA